MNHDSLMSTSHTVSDVPSIAMNLNYREGEGESIFYVSVIMISGQNTDNTEYNSPFWNDISQQIAINLDFME